MSKLGRYLDWDGLACYVDPVQQRQAQIQAEHEQQLRQMEKQLGLLRTALYNHITGGCNGQCCIADGKDESVRPSSKLFLL